MAFQQNLQETTLQFDDVSQTKDAKPVSASDNSTGFCDCNICLDSARDPVVTLCGHLYCWPCIYKWLHVQTSSPESDKQPNCPVCKAHISNSSLVPLYGRGNSTLSESDSEPKRPHRSELVIPSRPPAPGGSIVPLNQQVHPGPFQPQPPAPAVNHLQPFGSYATLGGPMTPTGFSNPFVGMVGEMVCAMIFRSPDSGLFAAYPYGPYQSPYPYPVAANGSPRVRRQALQVEKSLNRLTIFFFCCFILCLLLF